MKNTILIYNDSGAFNITTLKKELLNYFKNSNIIIDTINSEEIINSSKLNENILALFISGGLADKYFEKLGEKGNNNIRNYVKNGGIYLGICGGAYYACQKVEFEVDIPELKIEAEYKLNLINAIAKGTLYKELNINPFSNSIKSIALVDIEEKKTKNLSSIIYHGGPFFDLIEKECDVMAYYNLKTGIKLPAIIQKQYGKGRVIVSGVHFEYNLESLENILSYINNAKSFLQSKKEIKAKENNRQALFNNLMRKIR